MGSEGLVELALHYQSNMDALYVYVVPWSVFPIAASYPHYPQSLQPLPSQTNFLRVSSSGGFICQYSQP